MRELTGHATHKATDDTANKLTDCCANSLKQITAFIDKPVQAWNLCQSTNCCKHKSEFSNYSTHTENTQHCTWNQSSHCAQSSHNCCKQADTDNSLKKSFCINTLKCIHNAGEERHQYINRSLNQTGKILSDALKNCDKELENGVDNRRGVFYQCFKDTSNKLQCSISDSRNALNEYIHQHKNNRLDCFSNSTCTICNNFTEFNNCLANLGYNCGNKSCNTSDNDSQRSNNGCSTSGSCRCKSRQTYCQSGQAGTCQSKPGANTDNCYPD